MPCDSPPLPIALDDSTPVGSTAKEAIAFAEEARTAAFHWYLPDPDLPSPDTTLTLTQHYEGGQAFYWDGMLADNGIDRLCVSSVRVPLQIDLRTKDGALTESLSVVLVMDTQDHASFVADIDLAAHSGSFRAAAVDRTSFRTPRLTFDVQLGPATTHGRLMLTDAAEEARSGTAGTNRAASRADGATTAKADEDVEKAGGAAPSGVVLAEW